MTYPVLSLIICSFLMICVLCDAGITDIKTTYLHKRDIIASYTVAGIYLLSLLIMNEFETFKNSLISFVCVAGIYFIILCIENLKRKIALKKKKKNPELSEVEFVPKSDNSSVEEKPEAKKSSKAREIASVIFMTVATVFLGFSCFYKTVEDYMSTCIIAIVTAVLFCLFLLLKTKSLKKKRLLRKKGPVLCMASLVGLYGGYFYLRYISVYGIGAFLTVIIGILIYALLYLVLFRNIKDEELANVDEDGYIREEELDEEDEEIEEFLIIGGGDAILFGALSILFGGAGVMSILIYSAIACFCILIGRKIYNNSPISAPVPFIPAIAIGTILYTCGFSPLNFFI